MTGRVPVDGRASVDGRGPVGAGEAAPAHRRVLAQARFDIRSMASNGEQVLLTAVLPLLVLVGLSRSSVVDLGDAGASGGRVALAAPGVLALAIVSTAFTGQAIATGFDRRAGLLRLLGTTPLGRWGLLAGRVLAVLAVQAGQVVLLVTAALLLGWRPVAAGVLPAFAVAIAGSAAFVSAGLLLAGTVRAEAVLAVANLVWVVLLAGGGLVLPTQRLGAAGAWMAWLPSGALGDGLRLALASGEWPGRQLAVLLVWGVVAAAAAARWFRWE